MVLTAGSSEAPGGICPATWPMSIVSNQSTENQALAPSWTIWIKGSLHGLGRTFVGLFKHLYA